MQCLFWENIRMATVENLLDLSRKVALVTGGSRGIGEATALTLAKHGASVVINSRQESESKGMEVVEKIKSHGVEGLWLPGDISKPEVSEYLVKQIVARFTRLDILVNNAGITADNFLIDMSNEKIEKVIETNLYGTIFTTRAALKVMSRQRSGSIVSASSASAHGIAGQSNYSASKAGIEGFTKAVAVEYAKRGIRVNAIAAGPVDTPMFNSLKDNQKESLIELVPMKRKFSPYEIANTILFLVSDMASAITGAVIPVGGGMVR